MTQTDKEIIKEAREELDVLIKFYDRYVEEGYTIAPNRLSTILERLKEIRKTLEKRSLTDDQGYQEALELDEEDRRVLLKKEEKLEVVLKIIREKGGDSYNYSPSLLLGEIRKILES